MLFSLKAYSIDNSLIFSRCTTETNLCFFGSKCMNHYRELSCDCFGTLYEGELCDIYSEYLYLLLFPVKFGGAEAELI